MSTTPDMLPEPGETNREPATPAVEVAIEYVEGNYRAGCNCGASAAWTTRFGDAVAWLRQHVKANDPGERRALFAALKSARPGQPFAAALSPGTAEPEPVPARERAPGTMPADEFAAMCRRMWELPASKPTKPAKPPRSASEAC